MSKQKVELLKKPYESVINKSFRKNILWNNRFPKPPEYGWVTPDNVFSTINDIFRTSFVCKFIDGPKYVTNKLKDFSQYLNLENYSYTHERDEGYYAYHFYVKYPVDIIDEKWSTITVNITFEIQITTQLQEVLKELTHQYFESSRIDPNISDLKWKWEYDSPRFRSGYMCHTLHLLEAIIIDLRDKDAKA